MLTVAPAHSRYVAASARCTPTKTRYADHLAASSAGRNIRVPSVTSATRPRSAAASPALSPRSRARGTRNVVGRNAPPAVATVAER